MIRLFFHPTPNPAKVALFLEESGMPYEVVPVDTMKGEQHTASFRAVNPNGKLPAIIDTEGAGGKEVRVFDSSAILLYLAEKSGKFLGAPAERGEMLSWLFFISSGLGPYSGQSVGASRDWGDADASGMTCRAVAGREIMDGIGVAAGRNWG